MALRFYIPPQEAALAPGPLVMPDATARHVKVLRLTAGEEVTVFDGTGGEWTGELIDSRTMQLHRHQAVEREAQARVMLAVGMPANERMDALVEKAVELGVARIQPLLTRRSVLRLQGERAQRRVAHWQGVAIAACEQCGRNRVPEVAPVASLSDWLGQLGPASADVHRCLLSPVSTEPLLPWAPGDTGWMVSGPEGGLDDDETTLLQQAGFRPVSLGPRVLRADTAPLAALIRALAGC
ncbi:16S rRNA (uracil(1498)-N(3))-methyltransferase [Thiomonas bhubaneswarensis]|uniref:Ribosomal RNA small subunit methyltransferase E n=1 Tax=Thiomonas bhubaneswarensis TaxID=339866 RepID=A0A0K6HSY6_9BURK|nr:16S rRNA (uracil(1498)-N(3))-methyltransferase [Thiomonas bhubaneswarensis]CUA93893.1 RNA methyltransferase, RsmE family [Thiomonas bhubaneswarensis]